jgi:hypothetical protein
MAQRRQRTARIDQRNVIVCNPQRFAHVIPSAFVAAVIGSERSSRACKSVGIEFGIIDYWMRNPLDADQLMRVLQTGGAGRHRVPRGIATQGLPNPVTLADPIHRGPMTPGTRALLSIRHRQAAIGHRWNQRRKDERQRKTPLDAMNGRVDSGMLSGCREEGFWVLGMQEGNLPSWVIWRVSELR